MDRLSLFASPNARIVPCDTRRCSIGGNGELYAPVYPPYGVFEAVMGFTATVSALVALCAPVRLFLALA